jgi:hypothetical protein
MTASSPITWQDLVDGLIFTDSDGGEWGVDENYHINNGDDDFNSVEVSSDGLTITFGSWSEGGPTFASFTFNA